MTSEDLSQQLNEDLRTAYAFVQAGMLEQASTTLKSVIVYLERDPNLRHNVPSIQISLVQVELERHNNQQAKDEFEKLLTNDLTEDEMQEIYERVRSWLAYSDITRILIETLGKKATTLGYLRLSILSLMSNGVYLAKQSNYLEARYFFIQALQLAKKHSYSKEEFLILRNLAHTNSDLGYRAQALEYLMQSSLLFGELKDDLLDENPKLLEYIEESCKALDISQIFVYILCQIISQSKANVNQHYEWLEHLARVLDNKDYLLADTVFEHAARLLLEWTIAASSQYPQNWSTKRFAKLYQKTTNITSFLVQLDPSLANHFITLAEIAQYSQMVVHYETPKTALQAYLNELSKLETKRDQLVYDSLRRNWRLSERSSQLRELDIKISEILDRLSVMKGNDGYDLISSFAFPLISLNWSKKDSLVLGFHRLDCPTRLIIYLLDSDSSVIHIQVKQIPEMALESALEVLGQYPEQEIDFLVEQLSTFLLPEIILEFLNETSISNLIIVGDSVIQGIPWEGVERGPLVLGCKFSLTRAFTGYRVTCQASSTSVKALILGDPTEDLAASKNEAISIAQRLQESGMDVTLVLSATTSDFFLSSDPVQILHYAGHGNFLEYQPQASYLRLRDRPMTLSEIASLKSIPGALVILNACETASMPKISQMGNYNLIQPFFEAGASCVVGGLWPVRDGAAAQLVSEFYKYLLAGSSASEALRNARVTLRDRGFPRTQWASHVMFGMGEWQIHLPVVC